MNRGFEGTALAVLDDELALLSWDWWFNRAADQLRGDLQRPAERVRWRPDPADAWDHAPDAAWRLLATNSILPACNKTARGLRAPAAPALTNACSLALLLLRRTTPKRVSLRRALETRRADHARIVR